MQFGDLVVEQASWCKDHGNRLGEILRHDRVALMGTEVCGIVLYIDDAFAVVGLDTGYESTVLVAQLSLVGH